jgi:urease accessory protein
VIRARRINLLAAVAFALPSPAHAHLVNSGLGPFYDGALHLLLSPDDALGLLALALLAGLNGPRASRLAAMVLPVAWLIAGTVGLNLGATPELPWLSTLSFAILGLLVAMNAPLPAGIVTLLAGLFGGLHGLLNGSALIAAGAGWPALLGIVLTALAAQLLISAAVISLSAAWTRIAVRVAGSWIAAVGLLMLGWLLRGVR